MRLGLIISVVMHTALLAWAVIGMTAPRALPSPPEPPVPVEVISISELTRITQGRLEAKAQPTEASENRPTPAKEQPKPKVAPPPPPPPPPPKVEAPPPEPPPPAPKAEPTPDPIASKLAALEPPGPDPAELARLEEERKADDARKAEAARKAAEEEARRKAAAEAKRKADEKRRADLKRKQDEQKRKEAEERKRLEAEAKSKANFDPDRLSALLDKMPSAAPPPASKSDAPAKAPPKGPTAGAPDGKDRVLSAREIDIIRSRMRERLRECWTVNAGADGADQVRVEVEVKFARDGRVVGQPRIVNSSSSPLFRDFAESAVRALFKCQPFDFLPADKYEGGWEHMIVAFSLRDMF